MKGGLVDIESNNDHMINLREEFINIKAFHVSIQINEVDPIYKDHILLE